MPASFLNFALVFLSLLLMTSGFHLRLLVKYGERKKKKKKSPHLFNICKQFFSLHSTVTHIHIMCLETRPECGLAVDNGK